MRPAVFPLASLAVASLAFAGALLAGPVPDLQARLDAAAPAPILRLEPMEVLAAGSGPQVRVAWQDGVFAVDSDGTGGLPEQAIRDGDDLFTRDRGSAWTLWDVGDYVRRNPAAADLLLLDVGTALRQGTIVGQDDSSLEVVSEVSAGPWTHDVALTVSHDGGLVSEVRADVEGRPDAGFVLRPADGFPFEPRRPLA